MPTARVCLWCFFVLLALAFVPPLPAQERPTVGMPARISVVVAGPELEAKPPDNRKDPVVLRIVGVERTEEGRRYELEYTGMAPGRFNLADYLRRKDGGPATDLPTLRVSVQSALPPGQVRPSPVETAATPRMGGYRLAVRIGAVLWVLGLLAILWFVWRGRRRPRGLVTSGPATLADSLRPLIEEAIAGRADPARLAKLERSLMAYWRRQLGLGDRDPAEALIELRRHAEAGPLLDQLERWLHSPIRPGTLDVNALLEPYRRLPSNVLDAETRP